MARLTGMIIYQGSFKNARYYRNLNDKHTYVSEKGGASREAILTHPAFKRTRECMNEFGGCCGAVKAIRNGFKKFLPEMADKWFTGRLIKMTKKINLLDTSGTIGRRDILFSEHRSFLQSLVFDIRTNPYDLVMYLFHCSHSPARDAATLSMTDLQIKPAVAPPNAEYFRVIHHLSVVSDYRFSDRSGCYEPISQPDGISAIVYSDYTPIYEALTCELNVAFPAGTIITDSCNVIQCFGIEFFIRSNKDVYLPLKRGGITIGDVF